MRSIALSLLLFLSSLSLQATEEDVPEAFRGDTAGSPIQIDYSDWSRILNGTVLPAGHSSRQKASNVSNTALGTRVGRGNQKDTRNEGNRIMFATIAEEENLQTLQTIKESLELVPSEAPMKHWDKNEQLAYWLNLYNISLIIELSKEYPFRSLKKLKKGKKNIWTKQIVNVANVPLSLNDIHHKILLNKWDTTLVMYGLYQGYIGGPNILNTAYTGKSVRSMLIANAKEFVNSNRGSKTRSKTLTVSALYKENEKLFPNWKEDIKTHILNLTKSQNQAQVRATTKIKLQKPDLYTTDLYGGGKLPGSGTSQGAAGLMFADMHSVSSTPGILSGGNSIIGDGVRASVNQTSITPNLFKFSDHATASKVQGLLNSRLPSATIEYIMHMRKNGLMREGNIRIEKVHQGETASDEGN